MKAAVCNLWFQDMKSKAREKSTLQYLNVDGCECYQMHHVWSTVGTEVTSVRRAALKVKLLTDTYSL